MGMEIVEDELTGIRFGKSLQLVCLGNNGGVNKQKLQILHCSACKEDPELFKDAIFFITKSNLLKGVLPCGCGRAPRWGEEQKKVLAARTASNLGYTFLGFSGEYSGARTKCILDCTKHGVWSSTQLNNLLSKGTGCPTCRMEKVGECRLVDDALHIEEFLATGSFHPDTVFSRSTKRNTQGTRKFWHVYCPVCRTTAVSLIGSLKAGGIPCECGLSRQRQAYISYVKDGENCKAIKFGIAIDSVRRNKGQNTSSLYSVELRQIWEFPSTDKCKRAERACIRLLDTGILLRDEMRDGFSETTYPRNIDTIKYLYAKYGGTLIWENLNGYNQLK